MIKDVFFSAVLLAANDALLRLCPVVGAAEADRELIGGWVDRGRRGLADRFDAELELCLDYDARAGQEIRCATFAGFAPLIAGAAEGPQRTALLARLDSPAFLGHPGLRWPLLSAPSPEDPAFESRNYWRGPTWPVVNWLLWRALRREGDTGRADLLRRGSLDQQLAAANFYEYFDPLTGEPLGSPAQSWTAAVVLDWLAAALRPGRRRGGRSGSRTPSAGDRGGDARGRSAAGVVHVAQHDGPGGAAATVLRTSSGVKVAPPSPLTEKVTRRSIHGRHDLRRDIIGVGGASRK